MAFQEYTVAQVGDLKNGQMKELQAGETAVLLALVDETYYAYYPKCTHYGAPLAKGVLDGHRLVCPWHHACFNSTSGKRTEFPAVDGLPIYEVIVRNDEVIVRLPDELADRVAPPMPVGQAVEGETYVILGGGPAGLNAAIGMCEGGFRGRIVLVTSDSQLPYDRTKCSKDYLQGKTPEEKMYLRPEDFYARHGIETVKERVTNVDMETRNVAFETRAPLAYDKILICTGGQPRQLTVPGADKANVHILRTWLDSRELREDAKDLRRAVIIGSSFIGLEGAMSLQKLGCEVTVVAPQNVPFESVWGAEVGRQVQRWHEEAGVQFRLGRQVTELAGIDRVTEVVLDNGERLPTDLVLVGIGVQPATDMLSGVALEKDGGGGGGCVPAAPRRCVCRGRYCPRSLRRWPRSD